MLVRSEYAAATVRISRSPRRCARRSDHPDHTFVSGCRKAIPRSRITFNQTAKIVRRLRQSAAIEATRDQRSLEPASGEHHQAITLPPNESLFRWLARLFENRPLRPNRLLHIPREPELARMLRRQSERELFQDRLIDIEAFVPAPQLSPANIFKYSIDDTTITIIAHQYRLQLTYAQLTIFCIPAVTPVPVVQP